MSIPSICVCVVASVTQQQLDLSFQYDLEDEEEEEREQQRRDLPLVALIPALLVEEKGGADVDTSNSQPSSSPRSGFIAHTHLGTPSTKSSGAS